MTSRMPLRCLAILIVMASLVATGPAAAQAPDDGSLGAIVPATAVSFSPARGELHHIKLNLPSPETIAAAQVEIRSGDDDLLRTLDVPLKGEKTASIDWDGRDDAGMVVPDEAYHPVLLLRDRAGDWHRVDAREHSGGEEVYDFEKRIGTGSIDYTLPVSARVLVRAGIRNGPMLATVVDWQPRTEGFHAERWSGRDRDGLIAIEENPQTGYLIIGYQLPDNTIITYGNDSLRYRDYREQHDWPLPQADYANSVVERNGKLVRPEFNTPVSQQKSPRIHVDLLNPETHNPVEKVAGFADLITKVELNADDEAYLDQQRYEITFFVDNEFIAEEEQGFVPFNWRWSPAQYGLEPGRHILTINVSGYRGQVGVKNLEFALEAEAVAAEAASSQQ